MPYNLYPEQGGIQEISQNATFINPRFSSRGVDVDFSMQNSCMSTPGPWGLYETSTATIHGSSSVYFQYLGKIDRAIVGVKVVYYLKTTLADNVIYGEIAVFKGVPNLGGVPDSLTRVGYTDCNTDDQFLHAPESILKAKVLLSTPTNPGDDLWLAFGSRAATPAQFEAIQIDRMGTGLFLDILGQPSTIEDPCTTAEINTTVSGVAALVYLADANHIALLDV